MKYMYLLVLTILMGCGASNTQNEGLPEDLEELKSLRRDKVAEIKRMNSELEEIDLKIYEVDVNRVVLRKLVTTKKVETQSFEHFSTVQGAVESDDIVSISSEIGGKLTAMYLKEGQAVKKGQLVAKLDMEALNKQVAELQTQLDLAEDVYERQKRLWDQKIGSEVQYLQAKNAVDRLKKGMETINHQLTKANLYAPISGVVDMVNLKSGETAGPGTPIAMILNTYNLKMVADVPENYLGKINKGDRVKVNFPALGREIEAPVSLIGRKIDPTNRTFKVEVNLQNRDGQLKPNLLAELTFQDFSIEDVIVVPQAMVQQEVTGKFFVFVKGIKDRELIAEKRYVVSGESYEGDVVIESGLNIGDEMIDDGALGLSENDLITIIKADDEAKN
jgi:RND family efflux transporter MFP subunit